MKTLCDALRLSGGGETTTTTEKCAAMSVNEPRRAAGARFVLAMAATVAAAHVDAQPIAQAQASEARFFSQVRQLTYEGRRAGEGYFGAGGQAMVFQSEREPGNPFYQIYHLDLTTGDSRRISTGIGKTTCAFLRPDGEAVLFASTHLDPDAAAKQQAEFDSRATGRTRRYQWDYDPHMDIFTAAPDGSGLKRLTTSTGYDAEGAYSPDGKSIVFTSLRSAYPETDLSEEDRKRAQEDVSYFGDIYIMNADGTDQRRLTNAPGYDGGPFFSADGERIVWRHFDEEGATADVYTMRVDGTDQRRLTDFDSISWAPFLHPSGEYAVFSSNKHGSDNFELFLVDAEGERTPVRATFTHGFDGLASFSPDGLRLTWTSNRTAEGDSQIFLANWHHEAARAALAASPPRASTAENPADNGLRASVEFLASDALEGRLTGSPGARRAADYIAARLQALGLAPLGTGTGFFHPFHFTAGVEAIPAKTSLAVADKAFQAETNFRPLAFSADGEVEGEVVFAGYGLSVPGPSGEGYDSFADLDLTDKIALVLRYVPEDLPAARRQELNRYAGLRYKALLARERGAKAILVATGPTAPNAGALAPMRFDNSLADSGIVAMSVDLTVAEHLFAASGKNLREVQAALDQERPHFQGAFPLGVNAAVSVGVERIEQPDRNVVALLPPTAPARSEDGETAPPAEYVLVGAHYDHIGRGAVGSLADKDEQGEVHNGADDNASGTAVVLRLAQQLSQAETRRRGVVFAFWSGEELGLVGSSRFAADPPVPLGEVVAYLNFDMVGRLRDNKLIVQGVGSSNLWRRLIERHNVPAGFALVLQDDPYLPTDTTSFYPKNVPVLSFFTGSHENYNKPSDDAHTLNYQGMERIASFAAALVEDLAARPDRPDYATVERAAAQGSRDGLRAYLGTVPDYATEGTGVKLSGVRGGSPADKSGLRRGDVIVEFGGQTIANIYDYTFALDAVRIGEPVRVVVLRDGERLTVSVTPEVRKWRCQTRRDRYSAPRASRSRAWSSATRASAAAARSSSRCARSRSRCACSCARAALLAISP